MAVAAGLFLISQFKIVTAEQKVAATMNDFINFKNRRGWSRANAR